MARTRTSYSGPLAISLLLHVTVLGASLVAWPWLGKTKVVQVTPVTLLTAAQLQKLTAAAQADVPQEAKTEEPVPEAPADEPVPEPKPAPPEPKPAPQPAPQPKAPAPVPPKAAPLPKKPDPTPPKPADKGPQPKAPAPPAKPVSRPAPGFDLDQLAASIQKDIPARKSGSAQSSSIRGPSQQELDIARREAEGKARAAINDFNSQLAAQLQRAWHVNCGAESGVRVRVRIQLARDGSLTEAKLVDYATDTAIADPVTRAAATRALAAVSASSPFRNVPPPEAYEQWKSRIVAFDGKQACS